MSEEYEYEEEEGDEDEYNNDDIEADEPIEAEREEDTWTIGEDPFLRDFLEGAHWSDYEGGYHELQHGEPESEDAELRQTFDSFEEAVDYINEILTGADQYFDVYEAEEGYAVYYMGGSE